MITGAASGLGRAFAEELGKRKARLVLADINMDGAKETAERAKRNGAGDVIVEVCDVRKLEDLERVARITDDRFGATDLLINNAGVAVSGRVGEIPIDDWRWIVDINLWGVIYGCHVWVPRFRAQAKGHVINIASVAGLIAVAPLAAYNVTKFGVVGLSESLSAEFHGSPLGVTVVCPSFFKTEIAKNGRNAKAELAQEERTEKLMKASRVQADGVARCALDTAERGELYSIPMADARWMWRIKRVAPRAFQKLTAFAVRRFT